MIKLIWAILLITASFATQAESATSDDLATCLTDNTTGKERKDLAKWMFVAMSNHPDIKSMSNVTDQDKESSNKTLASIFTRLLTENCVTQVKAAIKKNGSEGIASSFKVLGGLAMQEIMTNQNVTNSFSEYTKYLDQKKLEAAFSQ